MKDWLSEEEIKAQLRDLTEETRKLRRDLHSLIRPSKPMMQGTFVHDRANAKQPRGVQPDSEPPPRRRK